MTVKDLDSTAAAGDHLTYYGIKEFSHGTDQSKHPHPLTATPLNPGTAPSALVIWKVLVFHFGVRRVRGSLRRVRVLSPLFVTFVRTLKLSTSVTVFSPAKETEMLGAAKAAEQAVSKATTAAGIMARQMWDQAPPPPPTASFNTHGSSPDLRKCVRILGVGVASCGRREARCLFDQRRSVERYRP